MTSLTKQIRPVATKYAVLIHWKFDHIAINITFIVLSRYDSLNMKSEHLWISVGVLSTFAFNVYVIWAVNKPVKNNIILNL